MEGALARASEWRPYIPKNTQTKATQRCSCDARYPHNLLFIEIRYFHFRGNHLLIVKLRIL